MTKHLADRRPMVLDIVEYYVAEYGHGPTVREVAKFTGLASPSAAVHHLRSLERSGDITRCPCGCRRYIPVAA